jgi:hypothetical protein
MKHGVGITFNGLQWEVIYISTECGAFSDANVTLISNKVYCHMQCSISTVTYGFNQYISVCLINRRQGE